MKRIFFVIPFLFLYLSCNIDHGLEPIRSGIQGVITYAGEWPAPPAEVRLVAATKFPPSGISDLIIGEQIPLNGSSYNYIFYLKPDTFKILGVAWREQDSIWDLVSIAGLYFSGSDSLSPGEIIVKTDTSLVTGINIFVNRANAKKVTDSKIIGPIDFQGEWPTDIQEVRVIATTKFTLVPSIILPSLLDLSFSQSIPIGIKSTTYTINAFPGSYVATGVIFFRTGQSLSLEDIVYTLGVGGLNISQYEVLEDSTVSGPALHIKF